ncbi:MAG: putative DNA-binding domain-containing protein [Gammaproteobacteria bacterium]|nr:putative DNA-binding domain-containing protein [Gammaproteobacteria bacterium]
MRALHEAQADFLAAVLGRDPAHAAPWPQRRLAVYRTNARENFLAALEAAFPLLQVLMGHDEFRAMAWAFQRSCPPRSGNQFYCGERLAGFLATHLAGTADAELAEVAGFEWLIQEVMVAADSAERFDFGQLAAIPAARHGALRFRFHPAVRLYTAGLPLFGLWQAYQQDGTVAQAALATTAKPEALLIRRSGEGVELHRLAPAEFRFLVALLGGASLEAAVGPAAADGGECPDPGQLLARWISAGVITGLAA